MSAMPTIAFFGATGGCTAKALAETLKSGLQATALARSPSKLTKLLSESYSIPASIVSSRLTVIAGSITDSAAVKQTLQPPSGLVSLIIFGIGGTPHMQCSITAPVTIDNPTVCQDGTRCIVSTLRDIRLSNPSAYKNPTISVISTTGVSKKQDVPIAMYPLYHYLLSVPHEDKRTMENVVTSAASGSTAVFESFVIIRPTLLMDNKPKGLDKVKVGWVRPDGLEILDEEVPGPQMGYGVSRKDVGIWIYENVIKGHGKWEGKCVSLTY